MKLSNFDWDERAIDAVITEDSRYTTYNGYGPQEAPEANESMGRAGGEELTVL